jgi:hypothetical protein
VFTIAETARMSRGREGTDHEDRFRAYRMTVEDAEAIVGLEIVARLRAIPIPPLTEQDVERLVELFVNGPGIGDPLPLPPFITG